MKTFDADVMLQRLFDSEGRLKAIPSTRPNRRPQLSVVLERLAREFEPGRRYHEPEVNAMLRRFHEDHCLLRRLLADFGYLGRESGWYWRAERPKSQVSDEAGANHL